MALLSYTEVPGVYARIDTGFVFVFDHVNARIKERTRGHLVLAIANPTRADATVRILSETASDAGEPLRAGAVLDAQTAVVPAGGSVQVSVPPLCGPSPHRLPRRRFVGEGGMLLFAVSEAAPLLTLLRRIRRRVRLWLALEGAVVGAAAGVIALAVAVAAAHATGRTVGVARPLALLLASAAVGAIVRGTRRIALAHCARFADAALDGQDRVLSAFYLRDDETPLARALVSDAAARARTLAPGGAVAPRRPQGLPALAIGAIVLAAAAVAPVRSRAARIPVPPPAAPGHAAARPPRSTSSATRRAAPPPTRGRSTTSGSRRWRRSWTARCAGWPRAS